MIRKVRTIGTLAILLTVSGGLMAQSVADAAKASKNASASKKVFGEDDLHALREGSHPGANEGSSAAGSTFCDASCQAEVRAIIVEKTPHADADALLADGLIAARGDADWQQLLARVVGVVCEEKKSGSQSSASMAVQKELMLKMAEEQKSIAELEETALKTSSRPQLEELKNRGVKLMVIGMGLKHMAANPSCPAN